MRKVIGLVAFLLMVVLTLSPAYTQPSYNFIQKGFSKRITSMAALPDNKAVLCFGDGTCSLMDSSGNTLANRLINPDKEIFYIKYVPPSRILVGVDRSGNIYLLNSSTLNIIDAFLARKNDEESFLMASLSSDGRYLAVSSRYYVTVSGKRYPETRLVVFDTQSKSRIFERDLDTSNDVLVDVFSLDFWGSYLIAETIDTKCELCQLTDNKIEVYRIDGQNVKKVSSFQSGLTLKSVVGNFLVAQRVQQNSTGNYLTYVFTLPDLKIKAKRMLDKIQSFIPFTNDTFLAIFSDGTLRMCNLNLECNNLVSVPLGRVAVAGDGSFIAIFKTDEVEVYSYNGGLSRTAYYQVSWDIAPSPPKTAVTSRGGFYCIYGDTMLVSALQLTTIKLRLIVVDDQGRPVPGAVVEIISSGGSSQSLNTSNNGTIIFELPPGTYNINVKKEGFSPKSLTQSFTSDTQIMLKLDRKKEERRDIQINVLSQDGQPLPGAKITITGRENITTLTNVNGKVPVNLPLGNYTILISAPKYKQLQCTFEVKTNTTEVYFKLEPEKVNIIVETLNFTPVGINVSLASITTNNTLTVKPGENVSLPVDAYQVLVNAPKNYECSASPPIVNALNGTTNVNVKITCKLIVTRATSISDLIGFLEKKMIQNVKMNMSVDKTLGKLPSINMLNSSKLDLDFQQRNKILVIEFFYTQCTGCKYLVPALRNLSRLPGVTVVSLTVSPVDTQAVLERYVKENNITWIIARDEENLFYKLNVTVFPTVVVISDGKILYRGAGAREELEQMNNTLPSIGGLPSFQNVPLGSLLRPETLIFLGMFLIMTWLMIGEKNEKSDSEEDSIYNNTVTFPDFGSSLHSPDFQTIEE
ncbi:carboxypeptidase regulatory-like domain-containing protein [Thermofilum sp.]|jgi:WD40 repeat protein/thiol-disulfide isomerase/thioredoxin|uniref:carboxypeptidase regulatory-like domain-containing protein n=1 Tax=Thermofilum sp. TaxID=1961369 RepID=UPI00258D3A41|nr:carboxypeptidase regulatory-like domain-containing protein [Thermofilum sp.]